MATVRIQPKTQRQAIAHRHGVSGETVRRWTRLIEQSSLDWVRCSPNGKTARFLHPYQVALLDWALSHSMLGESWVEFLLLHDQRLTLSHWKEHRKFPTFN